MAPVAQRVEIAHMKAVVETGIHPCQATRDLARYKRFTTAWALVVEKHTITGIHAIALAVVHCDPVRIELRDAVGTTRIEGRALLLRNLLHKAIELASARLIDPGFLSKAQYPNRLQNPQRAQRIAIGGVFRALKAHRHMALSAEVINLIWLDLLDDPNQVCAIGEVAVVEHNPRIALMWVLIEVINPTGVEAARAPLYAMNLVALLKQQLRQVAAVLSGDAGDQGGFGRECGHWGQLK